MFVYYSMSKNKSFNSVSKNMTTFLKSKTFLEQEDHSHYNKRLFKSCREILININKEGLITENSQLGSLEKGMEEYAYICGFIKKENTIKFLDFINTQCDNKLAFIISYTLINEPIEIIVTYDDGVALNHCGMVFNDTNSKFSNYESISSLLTGKTSTKF